MTSRERFVDSLLGGTIDRFFRYEHGPWPTTRELWLNEGWPAQVGFNTFFTMDPMARIAINSGYTDSPYHPKFQEKRLEETAEYKVYVDCDGVTKKEFKHQSDTSMPQFIRFPVADWKDWRNISSRLNPADARARIGDVSALKAACADPTVPTMLPICGAFGHPRNLVGDEALAYILYDELGLLDEILDNWRDLYVALIREVTRSVRVDALLIWEDMCYKTASLISPHHFNQIMIPRYREVIAEARACGVQVIIVDTDGNCLELIPLFIDAGVDALLPFEVQAGMDVVAIGKQFPQLGIMGGLDKRVLSLGHDAIRREVDRVLPFFRDRGRFIPTLDHTVPPNISLDAFQDYLECVRSYEGQ